MKSQIVILLGAYLIAGLALGQTVLKEENIDGGLFQYVDGGALSDASAAANAGHLIIRRKWVCPPGAVRPINGAVVFIGPPRWNPRAITLSQRQCLMQYIDPDTGAETDDIVDMIAAPDDGTRFLTVRKAGERLSGAGSQGTSNTQAAIAAGAAAAGYYNSCSGTAFNLLTDPVPNPKKNPSEYACFMGYLMHSH